MTKDELKKEAEEYAKENIREYNNICAKLYHAYLASAEPREKRIAELEKENTELKDKLNKIERKCKFNFVDLLHDVENESKQEKQLTKAKEIMNIAIEGIKHWGIVGGTERPFEKQAELEFNLFLEKAEQFLQEIEK